MRTKGPQILWKFIELHCFFFFSFKRSALIWFDSERRGTVLSFVFDMKRVFKMGLERFESLLQPCVRGVRVGYPCSGGFLQVFLSQLNPLLPFTLLITASWAMGITHLAARWYFPVDRSVSQSVSQPAAHWASVWNLSPQGRWQISHITHAINNTFSTGSDLCSSARTAQELSSVWPGH